MANVGGDARSSSASIAGTAHRVGRRIEANAVLAARLRRPLRTGATVQRAQAHDQFDERERLGYVVVAAGSERGDAVGYRIARR
jgi:hypothetical protein